MSKNVLKRITNCDMKAIRSLQLDKLGIHIQFDESNIMVARAIIIGPKDTPYEDGIYCFHIEFPTDYPFSPPRVRYVSTSKIRVHPNLYVGHSSMNYRGKVCLSVINTWSGPKWSTIMNIASIMMSVQSLLDANPLRNEPGYESVKGDQTDAYNTIVAYNNYKQCMLVNGNLFPQSSFLSGEYDDFNEIIHNHFKENKDKITERLEALTHKFPNPLNATHATYRLTQTINYSQVYTQWNQIDWGSI